MKLRIKSGIHNIILTTLSSLTIFFSDWILSRIVNDSNQKLQSLVQEKTFELISRGWCEHLANVSIKNRIYETLVKELIKRPGFLFKFLSLTS